MYFQNQPLPIYDKDFQMKHFSIITLALATNLTFAQPSKIIIRHDGNIELIHNSNTLPIDTADISSVPVYSEAADGILIPGVY